MNPCVKTGVMFREGEQGLLKTGDLFYIGGLFQIKGVPPGDLEGSGIPTDVVIAPAIWSERAGTQYLDSNLGLKFLVVSEQFKKYIEEWYPELKKELQ